MPDRRSALKANSFRGFTITTILRISGALLFGVVAGAFLGVVWMGLSDEFDPHSVGFFEHLVGYGYLFGRFYGAVVGGLLSVIIVITRVRVRYAALIGALIGGLALIAVALASEDSYYTLTALILIPGGALIGAGTARVLGRA
ncbi:MAG: hypothetical protein IPP13_24890 [Kouleothrix sp.]|jgi:dolichyl-phosphate-mannose--protein O-mannosyl transferase|nr:hypothetical protein [Kouleothrix sp.]